MAASLAARLTEECDAKVETVRGGLGEFSVLVDREEVLRTNRLWYPNLNKVFQKVKAHLSSRT